MVGIVVHLLVVDEHFLGRNVSGNRDDLSRALESNSYLGLRNLLKRSVQCSFGW